MRNIWHSVHPRRRGDLATLPGINALAAVTVFAPRNSCDQPNLRRGIEVVSSESGWSIPLGVGGGEPAAFPIDVACQGLTLRESKGKWFLDSGQIHPSYRQGYYLRLCLSSQGRTTEAGIVQGRATEIFACNWQVGRGNGQDLLYWVAADAELQFVVGGENHERRFVLMARPGSFRLREVVLN